MLIRASGPVFPELFLITLGESCHYLLVEDGGFSLFDPGLSVHIPMLLRRINAAGFTVKQCRRVFLTHLHPERIAGVPLLRKLNPSIEIYCSPHTRAKLGSSEFLADLYRIDQELAGQFHLENEYRPLPFEEYQQLMTVGHPVADGDIFPIPDGVDLRVVGLYGHARGSIGFLVGQSHFLIADESLGYFRGRALATPGGDESLTEMVQLVKRFRDLNLSGLCLPDSGVLTAGLVQKHLSAVLQNTEDLLAESQRSHDSGMEDIMIRNSLHSSFFSATTPDPVLQYKLDRSLRGIWRQILEQRAATPTVTS